MGNRIFYDQILQDTIRQRQCPISDEVDVTTLKDYMQVKEMLLLFQPRKCINLTESIAHSLYYICS